MRKIIWIFLIGFISFLYAGPLMDVKEIEAFWIWIALFALGIIGIIILFLSSKQMIAIRKLHKEMFTKQLEMEHSQSVFLASMGENIHDIVEQRFAETSDKVNKSLSENTVQDHRLLDVTNDLIEFLRLKSKKVKIVNEKFNLNNVLNEVSGSICSSFKGSHVELIFDIDNNIPRYLVGDSLNLEKILNNFLEYTMNQLYEGEVKLEIMMFSTHEEKIELQFKLIDTGAGLNSEKLETLFVPYYDEKSNEYTGLGLFVAKELISIMNGELSVQSVVGKGSTFTLSLPFTMIDASNKRNYRLPEEILTAKKVLIVDSNYNSALAIKKMFSYFRHDVKVVGKEEFVKNMYNLTIYDIIILEETLLNIRTVDYLNRIKKDKELKVVVLNSILQKNENTSLNPVADRSLAKPLNQERIFELIVDMYAINISSVLDKKEEVAVFEEVLIHRSAIVETPHIIQESFSDFNGMRLLIVEDNIINQKVLTNILKPSGIKMRIANNGREAVDMVKESTKKFDFVLMDINMPIMDGYAATQMIRYGSEFDTLPIVAFTALALDSEKQKIFNSGMNAFLTKPLKIGQLYTVFKMFIADIEGKKVQHHKIVEQINTLDIQAGIRYSNNNEAFYMEILKEFMDAYGQSNELFVKLVIEHRYEQVKMLCLDMKGLTGTIGAKDMHQLINEIYQRVIYNKQELLPNYIDTYQKECRKLNKSIERYIALQ
ncbi:MAG: response regulator [Sulfurovum sp.]|nr:MAG: response regulator [Sulfurovum sp.]